MEPCIIQPTGVTIFADGSFFVVNARDDGTWEFLVLVQAMCLETSNLVLELAALILARRNLIDLGLEKGYPIVRCSRRHLLVLCIGLIIQPYGYVWTSYSLNFGLAVAL